MVSHIRRHELLRAGDRVGVAVSGGIDSVVLLRLLLELRGELGIVLSVVHFNHKLRGAESDADQRFVADLARAQGLEFLCDGGDVAGHAAREGVSVEAAARELRYASFRRLLLQGTPGAEAPDQSEGSNRSAESAAPPKSSGQPNSAAPPKSDLGLKPNLESGPTSGPEAPLFHGNSRAATEERAILELDRTARDRRLDKIVTGHTLDDQAETVLMRMIRGTGLAGLSGIHPRILVEDDEGERCGEIVRPLLGVRRHELEPYLNEIGQGWREDSSNSDHAFTRNRVRGLLLPLLEKEFNPAVAENLADLAEIARGEEEYWDNEVAGWMGTAVHWVEPEWAHAQQPADGLIQITGPRGTRTSNTHETRPASNDLQERIDQAPWLVANASASRPWLLSEPVAVQRRVVKAIGEHAGIPLEFRHVEEILRFAEEEGASGKHLSLPLGWQVVRNPEELLFLTPDLREEKPLQAYEYDLPLPGTVFLNESGTLIEAQRIPADHVAAYNPDELLNADSVAGPLKVRNWRAGDRFWPAHTKSPKKVKELLQDRHVARPERVLWPVVLCGEEIVWVRGCATPAKLGAKPGHDAVRITAINSREHPEE